MTPPEGTINEAETREEIDRKLLAAGWVIQDKKNERWKSFKYDELRARDKTNLDIFWLKDESLEDTENLPAPEVLAQEIVEQLEAALEEFRSVEEVLAVNGNTE